MRKKQEMNATAEQAALAPIVVTESQKVTIPTGAGHAKITLVGGGGGGSANGGGGAGGQFVQHLQPLDGITEIGVVIGKGGAGALGTNTPRPAARRDAMGAIMSQPVSREADPGEETLIGVDSPAGPISVAVAAGGQGGQVGGVDGAGGRYGGARFGATYTKTTTHEPGLGDGGSARWPHGGCGVGIGSGGGGAARGLGGPGGGGNGGTTGQLDGGDGSLPGAGGGAGLAGGSGGNGADGIVLIEWLP